MRIVTAGMLISFSGIVVVAAALLGIVPQENKTMVYAFVAIGWVFIIIGLIIRIIGLKLERKQELARQGNAKQSNVKQGKKK